jgi:hypothetical protein
LFKIDADGRPVTPTRHANVSFANGIGYHHGGGSDLNEPAPHGQSNGSHGDGDGDVFMTNSEDHSGSKDTQGSSFGPSAQPRPPYSHTAPSQQMRRESGMSSFSQTGVVTPMVPGSQPGDYTNEASTTQTTSDKKSSGPSAHQDHTQSLHGSRDDFPDLHQPAFSPTSWSPNSGAPRGGRPSQREPVSTEAPAPPVRRGCF